MQVKLKKESDGRKTAEAAAATAAEKVKSLEETLKKVSESAERGKSLLRQELLQLQTESSLSTTRLKAGVSLSFAFVDCASMSFVPNWTK